MQSSPDYPNPQGDGISRSERQPAGGVAHAGSAYFLLSFSSREYTKKTREKHLRGGIIFANGERKKSGTIISPMARGASFPERFSPIPDTLPQQKFYLF